MQYPTVLFFIVFLSPHFVLSQGNGWHLERRNVTLGGDSVSLKIVSFYWFWYCQSENCMILDKDVLDYNKWIICNQQEIVFCIWHYMQNIIKIKFRWARRRYVPNSSLCSFSVSTYNNSSGKKTGKWIIWHYEKAIVRFGRNSSRSPKRNTGISRFLFLRLR